MENMKYVWVKNIERDHDAASQDNPLKFKSFSVHELLLSIGLVEL